MRKNQEDIYAVLTADAQLKTLLGATAGNTKIFPVIPDNFEDFPCMAYSVMGGTFRSYPHGTEDLTLEFHIYDKDKTHCEDIFKRLNDIINYLQKYDKTIVYVKQSSEIDLPEADRKLWGKVIRYQVWTKN